MSTLRAVAGMFTGGRGKVLLFCWLGWVFDFYDLMLFQFTQVLIARDLQLSVATDVPWIDAFTLLATAVGGFWFGSLADRRGRRFALSASILLYSGGALMTAFADGYYTLLCARIVTGLGVGGEWGVGHAAVAEAFPSRLRNRAAAILQAGSPVALALAATVGCFIAPEVGWRTCFFWSALPACLVFFARAAMPGEDTAPGRLGNPFKELLSIGMRRQSAWILLLLVLHMTGFWCTYAWLPRVLMIDLSASPAYVGLFFLCVNAVHVVADLIFGPLADRFGRRRTFATFCMIFACGLLLVASSFHTFSQDRTMFLLAMAAVGLGAGTWSCFGVLFAENYPARSRGTASSGLYNLARGSQLFTQPMLAWLHQMTGTFAVALHVGAATAVLSAVVIYLVPRVEAEEGIDAEQDQDLQEEG